MKKNVLAALLVVACIAGLGSFIVVSLATAAQQIYAEVSEKETPMHRSDEAKARAAVAKARAEAEAKDFQKRLHTPDSIVKKSIKGYEFVVSNPSLFILDHGYRDEKNDYKYKYGHAKVKEWVNIYENQKEYLVVWENGKKMKYPKNTLMDIKGKRDLTIIYERDQMFLGGFCVNYPYLSVVKNISKEVSFQYEDFLLQ